MAEDSLIFHAKALAMQTMIERLSSDSNRRELEIQTEKLARMAKEFDEKFPWTLARTMPAAKFRKKKGPHLHRLAQQSKHLDKLLQGAVAEFAVQHSPMVRTGGKGKRNKFCQKVVAIFNETVYQTTERLKLQAMEKAVRELTT